MASENRPISQGICRWSWRCILSRVLIVWICRCPWSRPCRFRPGEFCLLGLSFSGCSNRGSYWSRGSVVWCCTWRGTSFSWQGRKGRFSFCPHSWSPGQGRLRRRIPLGSKRTSSQFPGALWGSLVFPIRLPQKMDAFLNRRILFQLDHFPVCPSSQPKLGSLWDS